MEFSSSSAALISPVKDSVTSGDTDSILPVTASDNSTDEGRVAGVEPEFLFQDEGEYVNVNPSSPSGPGSSTVGLMVDGTVDHHQAGATSRSGGDRSFSNTLTDDTTRPTSMQQHQKPTTHVTKKEEQPRVSLQQQQHESSATTQRQHIPSIQLSPPLPPPPSYQHRRRPRSRAPDSFSSTTSGASLGNNTNGLDTHTNKNNNNNTNNNSLDAPYLSIAGDTLPTTYPRDRQQLQQHKLPMRSASDRASSPRQSELQRSTEECHSGPERSYGSTDTKLVGYGSFKGPSCSSNATNNVDVGVVGKQQRMRQQNKEYKICDNQAVVASSAAPLTCSIEELGYPRGLLGGGRPDPIESQSHHPVAIPPSLPYKSSNSGNPPAPHRHFEQHQPPADYSGDTSGSVETFGTPRSEKSMGPSCGGDSSMMDAATDIVGHSGVVEPVCRVSCGSSSTDDSSMHERNMQQHQLPSTTTRYDVHRARHTAGKGGTDIAGSLAAQVDAGPDYAAYTPCSSGYASAKRAEDETESALSRAFRKTITGKLRFPMGGGPASFSGNSRRLQSKCSAMPRLYNDDEAGGVDGSGNSGFDSKGSMNTRYKRFKRSLLSTTTTGAIPSSTLVPGQQPPPTSVTFAPYPKILSASRDSRASSSLPRHSQCSDNDSATTAKNRWDESGAYVTMPPPAYPGSSSGGAPNSSGSESNTPNPGGTTPYHQQHPPGPSLSPYNHHGSGPGSDLGSASVNSSKLSVGGGGGGPSSKSAREHHETMSEREYHRDVQATHKKTRIRHFTDPVDFEGILRIIGGCHRWQSWVYFLIALQQIPHAMLNLCVIFMMISPDHWCYIKELDPGVHSHMNHWTNDEVKNISVPRKELVGTDKDASCYMYDRNYHDLAHMDFVNVSMNLSTAKEPIKCDNWTFDKSEMEHTIVTQWNLVCDRNLRRADAHLVYALGYLFGCVCSGFASDRFGRKPTIVGFGVLASIFGLILPYSTYFSVFLVIRFFSAVCNEAADLAAYVLCMEITGTKYRAFVGCLQQAPWAIGYTLVAAIAYATRDWRQIQMIAAALHTVSILLACVLPESPRWLIMMSRVREAEYEIRRACRMNRKQLPPDLELTKHAEHREWVKKNERYKITHLLKSKVLVARTGIVFLIWAVTALIYYGICLSLSDQSVVRHRTFSGNLFLNNVIAGAIELPVLVLTVFFLSAGRKKSQMCCLIAAGFMMLGVVLSPKGPEARPLRLVFMLLGKSASQAAFCILYIFAAEMYPTVIRNTMVGLATSVGRIGSGVAGYIAILSDITLPIVPMIIFGVLSFIAGIMTIFLPETMDQPLPETLKDAVDYLKGDPYYGGGTASTNVGGGGARRTRDMFRDIAAGNRTISESATEDNESQDAAMSTHTQDLIGDDDDEDVDDRRDVLDEAYHSAAIDDDVDYQNCANTGTVDFVQLPRGRYAGGGRTRSANPQQFLPISQQELLQEQAAAAAQPRQQKQRQQHHQHWEQRNRQNQQQQQQQHLQIHQQPAPSRLNPRATADKRNLLEERAGTAAATASETSDSADNTPRSMQGQDSAAGEQQQQQPVVTCGAGQLNYLAPATLPMNSVAKTI